MTTEHPLQYGNNFYFLFDAMRKKAKRPDSLLVSLYLEPAEAYGEKWEKFVRQNDDLLQQIFDCLAQLDELDNAMEEQNEQKWSDTDAFDALNQRGIALWNTFNPLLETAEAKMTECGINPAPFTV